MKCDELKAYKADVTIPVYGTIADAEVYLKDKADAAITELKHKLKTVNELIKTARQMLEDAKATAYTESVDAGMRERRLKRALWLARAYRAGERQMHFALCHNHSIDRYFTINGAFTPTDRMTTMRTARDWAMKWENVECKCRAMAEKFK